MDPDKDLANQTLTGEQYVNRILSVPREGTYFEQPARTKLISLQNLEMAVISCSDLQRCFSKFEAKRQTQLVEFLESLPFFAHWSKTQVKKLVPSLQPVDLQKGQILIREGTQNDDVYIVKKGTFSGVKNYKEPPTENLKRRREAVKSFLEGNHSTQLSLRSVFYDKIRTLTHNRQLA